ncbi:hypothetical protein IWX49DRAFT_217567 [Phyllosticta citricarpa]
MEASAARTPDLLSPSASPTATRHDTTYMSRFSHGETRSSTSPKHHHHHHHHHHHQPCGNCAVSSGCNTSCTVPSRRSRTCHLSTFSGNLSCCIPAHRQVPLLTLGQASPSAAPNDHHDATGRSVATEMSTCQASAYCGEAQKKDPYFPPSCPPLENRPRCSFITPSPPLAHF